MNLQNTKTLTNLMRAFAGESLARNRYDFAAEQAETDGLPVIAAVFRYTAGQEKEHAEIFANELRLAGVPDVEIGAAFPSDMPFQTADIRWQPMSPIQPEPRSRHTRQMSGW